MIAPLGGSLSPQSRHPAASRSGGRAEEVLVIDGNITLASHRKKIPFDLVDAGGRGSGEGHERARITRLRSVEAHRRRHRHAGGEKAAKDFDRQRETRNVATHGSAYHCIDTRTHTGADLWCMSCSTVTGRGTPPPPPRFRSDGRSMSAESKGRGRCGVNFIAPPPPRHLRR